MTEQPALKTYQVDKRDRGTRNDYRLTLSTSWLPTWYLNRRELNEALADLRKEGYVPAGPEGVVKMRTRTR